MGNFVSYSLFVGSGVEDPTHMAVPESFYWTMWILRRVTVLVVVPVRAHPIDWIPLLSNTITEEEEEEMRKYLKM